MDCQGCGGIGLSLDIGNFLSGLTDGLHGGFLGFLDLFHRCGSGILHVFNRCILRPVDFLLCGIHDTSGIFLYTSSGILDLLDLCGTFVPQCLQRRSGGTVHRIIEASHRANCFISGSHSVILRLFSNTRVFLCPCCGIFGPLGKLGHLLLGLLGNPQGFNHAVGIGEDFLDLLDLRLGFQGVIVQRSTLHLQIEVGAGKAVFRGTACGCQHQFKGVLTGDGGHLLGHLHGDGRHRVDYFKGAIRRDTVAIQLGAANLCRYPGIRNRQSALTGIQLENQLNIRVVLRQMDGERNATRHHIEFIRSSKHSHPSLLSCEQRP